MRRKHMIGGLYLFMVLCTVRCTRLANSIEIECAKNRFFHIESLECKNCPSGLITSEDGLGCTCDRKSKISGTKDGHPVCAPCENGTISTSDGNGCVLCREGACDCAGNKIKMERSWNGTILDERQCLPCPPKTFSSKNRCLSCTSGFIASSDDDFDDLTYRQRSKYCKFGNSPKDWPDVRNTYINKFKSQSIDSYYFRTELRFAYYSCEHGSRKACVQLANMCALTLFSEEKMPCKPFVEKGDEISPSLFYPRGEAPIILNRRTITQPYSLDKTDPANKLNIIFAEFGLRGELEAIAQARLPCPFFSKLPFGVNLLKKCKISTSDLINVKMMFFVPYLLYFQNRSNVDKKNVQQLPVLIKNNDNTEDVTQWRLVNRFFFIDTITGYKAISENASYTKSPELQVIRYMKSMSLVLRVQERNERGKIFPPLLVVEYEELTSRELLENSEISIQYKVTYSLTDGETSSYIEVYVGVFAIFAVAYAATKSWNYSRRNCNDFPDAASISWFVVYCFGAIGNAIIIVCSGVCIYTFALYKGQKVVHMLLPNADDEWTIAVCTIIAFAFKTIEILGLMYQHRRISIFFIDWEQPRVNAPTPLNCQDSPGTSLAKCHSIGRFNRSNAATKSASERIGARRSMNIDSTISQSRRASRLTAEISSERNFSMDDEPTENDNSSVGIWRTCIVANEWLKLKTERRIHVTFQIFATLFILEILGGKFWSVAVSELSNLPDDESLPISESFTLVYAVGIFVYLSVYSVQWWLSVFVYQKYIKNKLQEFVDLCSIANISVFVLSHDLYGYYIHGRSVHGFADADLLTLINDLKREENNLCAHRGLIPGTTDQTFIINVSKTFRTFYERLLGSQDPSGAKFLRSNVSNNSIDWDQRWKTHLRLRKFFTDFLDHCYKNVDYTVKEKRFMEKICDLEVTQVDEKSIFYIDRTYSFDRTIFYGNEWTLTTFEINVFLLVIVFGGNYILASIITLLAAKVVKGIAEFNGKQHLADKTFIDDRFLVS